MQITRKITPVDGYSLCDVWTDIETTGVGTDFSDLYPDKDPATEAQLVTETLLNIEPIDLDELKRLYKTEVISYAYYIKHLINKTVGKATMTGRLSATMSNFQLQNKSHIMGSALDVV